YSTGSGDGAPAHRQGNLRCDSQEWRRGNTAVVGGIKNGNTDIHVCKFSLRPNSHRFFWLSHRLLRLGRPGSVWFSQDKPGSQSNHGLVGLLDARIHAVHHGRLPVGWIDLVQCLRQGGSFVYGGGPHSPLTG